MSSRGRATGRSAWTSTARAGTGRDSTRRRRTARSCSPSPATTPPRSRPAGPRWNGRGRGAETENGPIVLALPRDCSARLETGPLTGPLDVHVPLPVTLGDDEPTLRRFVTTLGSGGPPVRVVTTNGPVSI